MGRGLYSAVGRWPEAELPARVALLRELGKAIDRHATDDELGAAFAPELRSVIADAVRAIRVFEARVGRACGVDAEVVTTPQGPAIELGNRGHLTFGADHEAAAAVVAQHLARVLDGLGATGTFWFTMD